MPAMTNSAVPIANADSVSIHTWMGIFSCADMQCSEGALRSTTVSLHAGRPTRVRRVHIGTARDLPAWTVHPRSPRRLAANGARGLRRRTGMAPGLPDDGAPARLRLK